MPERVTNEDARVLRALWFRYLDTLETVRPKLHGYCLKLTGSVFDAEDLVQDALIKGFAVIGRQDRPSERIMDVRAYLFRIATNAWIDQQRNRARQFSEPTLAKASDPAVVTRRTAETLFELTSPQERAAVVLKDVFDFSIEETADLLAVSIGAVKSALHRGREKLDEKPLRQPTRGVPASAELIDSFIEAFRLRDIELVTALLLESVAYEVQGVGFERGRKGQWIDINLGNAAIPGVHSERLSFDDEWIVVGLREENGRKRLLSVVRVEEAGRKISRIINYFYCPDTLAFVATELGMLPPRRAYHQEPDVLARMINDAMLPFRDEAGGR